MDGLWCGHGSRVVFSVESGIRAASAGLEVAPAVAFMAGSEWGRGSSVMPSLNPEPVAYCDVTVI